MPMPPRREGRSPRSRTAGPGLAARHNGGLDGVLALDAEDARITAIR
jgi:hypothetical protein